MEYVGLHGVCSSLMAGLGRESHHLWLGIPSVEMQPTLAPESRHRLWLHHEPYCLASVAPTMTLAARIAVLRISGSIVVLAGCALAARAAHGWLAQSSNQPRVAVTQSTGGNIMVVMHFKLPPSVTVPALGGLALGLVLWWWSYRIRNATRPNVDAG
jgi:hypothetical protein